MISLKWHFSVSSRVLFLTSAHQYLRLYYTYGTLVLENRSLKEWFGRVPTEIKMIDRAPVGGAIVVESS